ncbi:hypothetical protein Q4512_03355 [Oceanihabitans sp. 2_MG-2023]|uniref:hypothetical protein n=1 Tax=Oceanihabitans sp. 2_MG-2023 TaxID=3062661 RepID=UPI0026E1B339|nr:hypothetical protein [Oceanihabitans sp. 2_MG-2023]MDO6595936.1 hypothetical protein [Oceanihabitans sp. 2_MG-2023]
MKKIVVLLLIFSIFSCSLSDDTTSSQTVFLPIENVTMPNEFIRNQTHNITLSYYKPSSCYVFNSIYSTVTGNETTFAIVTDIHTSNVDCQQITTESETSFDFTPTELGSYIFKFWHGVNGTNTGQDVYLEYEIEVVE